MLQRGLFEKAEPQVVVPKGDPDGLRPYQREDVEAIREKLEEHRSTLYVAATGLGKTTVFATVVKHWPGNVLIVAHRGELLEQARARIAQMTGENVDLEQAQMYSGKARIIVASVQTFTNPERHARYAKNYFGLIVVDEAHHAVAKSYTRIFDYFDTAKLLGVTATPMRADELAMGIIFHSVASVRDIRFGIDQGYLCKLRVQQIHVTGVDLSKVKTTAGDLNAGELDAVMSTEENLHGVVTPTMEHAGQRPTIVFCTSVENAHRIAEIMNRHRTGCAMAVDGTTDQWQRRSVLARHRRGEFQFLCNVGVLTEGYDDPAVSCIAMARPTKSQALYMQCIGRGLRTLAGKDDCLVLDFVGNAGKHRLVGAVDILGGRYPEDVRARAKKIAEKASHIAVDDALVQAEEQLAKERSEAAAAKRRKIIAEVQYRSTRLDPFAVFGTQPPMSSSPWANAPADVSDIEKLQRYKIDVPKGCTRVEARRLLDEQFRRFKNGLCTFKQAKSLNKYGHDTRNMKFNVASRLLTAYAENGWKALDQEVVRGITERVRQIGEEG